jgi:hypothetical protein
MNRLARALGALAAFALPVVAASTAAGADTTLVGYNATTLAVGAQFAFNVPNVVPLPNENLIEEDVPFARTNVGGGPVVDSVAAPYYPGDIAADLGSLLETFGAPALPLNDPLLAEAKYPTSPGYQAHKTFGILPAAATASLPSIFSSVADATAGGGDATGTVSDISLDNLSAVTKLTGGPSSPVTKALGTVLNASTSSLVDVGNISATDNVVLGTGAITATSSTQVSAINIAGLISIAGLTSSAAATSDGTTGTPTATLHLGQVTIDGQAAYIDDKGVHIPSSNPSAAGITPAQLQQTVNGTLAQDGIAIRVLDPVLTTNGAAATANAGGLVITLSHQFDIPFIPGEPTIPVPMLGNVGLPAGLYTATTSLTLGLAQATVAASGLSSDISAAPPIPTGSTTSTPDTSSFGGSTFGSTFGGTGVGSTQSLVPTGPGSATGAQVGQALAPAGAATSFPIRGIPPPLGWTITALVLCVLCAYPLLLLARWQFLAGRRV